MKKQTLNYAEEVSSWQNNSVTLLEIGYVPNGEFPSLEPCPANCQVVATYNMHVLFVYTPCAHLVRLLLIVLGFSLSIKAKRPQRFCFLGE